MEVKILVLLKGPDAYHNCYTMLCYVMLCYELYSVQGNPYHKKAKLGIVGYTSMSIVHQCVIHPLINHFAQPNC